MANMTPLDNLLHHEALDIHFQPILSLKQKVVMGLEALARPHAMTVGEMFTHATKTRRLLEVDRLCRRKALEKYRELVLPCKSRPLLFFNFEASVIDEGVVGSGSILNTVQASGLDPGSIVIEVNESKVVDTDALIQFVDHHRKLGFLIALDDLGAGHSNLPRIAQLRPHIIKLDRNLITGIDNDFFKQETMKSLVSLCRSIGSLVLAEGVENLAEVDACAALGAELFQGFHFCHPKAPEKLDLLTLQPVLMEASYRLRERVVNAIQTRRLEGNLLKVLAEKGKEVLLQSDPSGFDAVLAQLVRDNSSIEAVYLLDKDGVQISDTHLGHEITCTCNHLFFPSSRGADHSNKEYCLGLLDAGLKRYTTKSYLSLATGQPCRTVAIWFTHSCHQKYVLCIDLKLSDGGFENLRENDE